MSPDATAGFLAPEELASLRQVRRYAVPRWMIEASAERRAAGDWRGACAAAGFDVMFDPAAVAVRYGPDVAEALHDDLLHLVPDLLRWHLPRVLGGRSTLAPDLTVILAGYGAPADVPGARTPHLCLRTPPMIDGPQRISLRFGVLRNGWAPGTFRPGVVDWRTGRYLWDARRTGELRARVGGLDRLPFLRADGTPLDADELPDADPGSGDPVARAEWVTLLYGKTRVTDALAAVGVELDPTPPSTSSWYRAEPESVLTQHGFDVPRLAAEARRIADLYGVSCVRIAGGWRVGALLEFSGEDGADARAPRIRLVEQKAALGFPLLPPTLCKRLPDLDLLRAGVLAPAQLHPLVAGSLFPSSEPAVGPPGPTPPAPVRVRCRGEWHEVVFRDGRLDSPHSSQEQRRERALRAFGGAVTGCFAVEQSCTTGIGRLPRSLREQRRELFLRAQHGDTPGVLELLDAGVDPRVRDGGRRGLLHVLGLLDHERLLPRLLAAGLDLEATEHRHRTPLCVAVADGGSADLVRALVEAGARIDVTDHMELSLHQLIRKYRRTDLRFLGERVEKEYPDIGADWWEEWEEEREDDFEGNAFDENAFDAGGFDENAARAGGFDEEGEER
ncbi:ankyrin repeat domain-containing protein [Streptomyces sp. NPDC014734]|uniref:ankyrin repeat domain-containing protein n=1 Tax=Streptomyces sp. NPDC014734 TaxID=3364886 RepID=UPI0036FA7371